MATHDQHVLQTMARLEAELGGAVGVAARDLDSGRELAHRADELFPLASVFKIPLMVDVMRRVDAGGLALDERVALVERLKSPGGTLIHCHAGLQPTVRDLLYLMITLSDNTATDMLWRLVGVPSINATMRALGLETIDCFMPNREYFLIETLRNGDWQGLSGPEVVARWRSLDETGRDEALRRVAELNAAVTGEEFLRRYTERFGYAEEKDHDDCFVIDQALDNQGSPRDIVRLLAMIAETRCASRASCKLMIETLTRQEWRNRIPAGLPAGVKVANKTGSVSGTINDAAIVFPPAAAPFVLVVFCKGLSYRAQDAAEAAIAHIAGSVYHAFTGGRTKS